ncbi:unnamed protein product, partial [Pylaiella littoralis]
HHWQHGVTPRFSSGPTREQIKGHKPNPKSAAATATAPPLMSRSSKISQGSARNAEQTAETQRSARSTATTVASLSSSRDGRGLQRAPDSTDRGSLFSDGRTTRSLSGASSAASLTPCSSTCTPRETSRTTTTMAMSTARAEATLAVLEAERAQLEHRLKKVEDELRQEQLMTMKESRKRGKRRTVR